MARLSAADVEQRSGQPAALFDVEQAAIDVDRRINVAPGGPDTAGAADVQVAGNHQARVDLAASDGGVAADVGRAGAAE